MNEPTGCPNRRFGTRVAIVVLFFGVVSGCSIPPSPYGTPLPQSGLALNAKTCANTPAPPSGLSKQPNYRQILVSVEDNGSQPMPNLTAADLHLAQAGKQIPIAYFQPQSATVGILVDTSGSMAPKLANCREALHLFIDDLKPSDEIFLFPFTDHVFVMVPPTTDHAKVILSLDLLHAYGRTALYDSVNQGLETMSHSCAETRVLLVITDGMDTASSSSLGDVKEMARKTGVRVYSIGIGKTKTNSNFPLMLAGPGASASFSSPQDDRVDIETLKVLAEDTAGESFLVTPDDNGAALKHAAAAIAGKIGNQYVVGFIGDGSTSQLTIRAVKDRSFRVRVIGPDRT